MKPGVYRAKVTSHGSNDSCFVVIPQVFLDKEVPLADYVGTVRPSLGSTGYVAYIAGDSAWPVWLGGADALFDSQQLEEEAAAAQAAADAAGSAAVTAQAGVNALESNRLLLDGSNSPMTGQLSLVGDPTADAHAARKKYVDDQIASEAVSSTVVGGRVDATAGLASVSGPWKEIVFPGTATWDSGGFLNGTSGLTVPVDAAGFYSLTLLTSSPISVSVSTSFARIALNGSEAARFLASQPDGTYGLSLLVQVETDLDEGDDITAEVAISGTTATWPSGSRLTARRLGDQVGV